MTDSLQAYQASRAALLAKLTETLSKDERFIAAWLTGSFGRGEADAVSDLDLTLVVSRRYSASLCARPEPAGAKTTKERFDLFSSFGQPAAIHENNNNAPEGGTFTFVLYTPSALMVDWILLPQAIARRPAQSRLLFDKAGIPLSPPTEPESEEQRVEMASNSIAFFWMMAAVTAKYIVRDDAVFVNCWLEALYKLVREVERLAAGEVWQYERGSLTVLESTPESQIRAMRRLCLQMQDLMPGIAELGGRIPVSPLPEIEALLALAEGQ